MSDTPLGRFCWFDLMTADPDAAPDFYGQVAGWGTTPFEGSDEPYLMWTNQEAPIGGVSGDMVAQCMDPQGAAFAVHAVGSA